MRIISFIAVTLFATLWSLPAVAASFDCSKATTETEIAICNDDELSALDELVSTSYNLSRKASSDKQTLLSEQRAWIIERDKIWSNFDKNQYSSNRVHLTHFMSKRIGSLLETAVGTTYDTVKDHLSKNKETVLYFSNPNRVILFSPKINEERFQKIQNALFFDANQKLESVFIGDLLDYQYGCEDYFSDEIENSPSKLTYINSCGTKGRHARMVYSYNLGADCINMTAYTRSARMRVNSDTTYKFQNSKNSCLEDYNYNFDSNESPHYFFADDYDYNDVELVTKRGLLEFLTDYWLNPSITELTCSQFGKDVKTHPVALTRLKLINLFRHFSENKDEPSSIGLNHRKKSAYILRDSWYWDKNYKSLINIYDLNKEFFDLFLPIVKLLDDDDFIKLTVDFLINYRDNPDMRYDLPKFAERDSNKLLNECDDGYFTVTKNEVTATVSATQYFNGFRGSFWERRRNDETDEITLELLKKIKDVLN